MMIDLRTPDRCARDRAAGDDSRGIAVLTRTDAFLLLLAATNGIHFRSEEWKWAPTAENGELVIRLASRDLQAAMFRFRQDAIRQRSAA